MAARRKSASHAITSMLSTTVCGTPGSTMEPPAVLPTGFSAHLKRGEGQRQKGLCVCVRARASVRACLRACVRACARVRVRFSAVGRPRVGVRVNILEEADGRREADGGEGEFKRRRILELDEDEVPARKDAEELLKPLKQPYEERETKRPRQA